VVAFRNGNIRNLEDLRVFARSELASYQLPSLLKAVGAIPKNAMGKVNKKELVRIFLE
jgi:malonyl-CoA/methylmalonyl-CoA synthetase